jgi:hypothetical protein
MNIAVDLDEMTVEPSGRGRQHFSLGYSPAIERARAARAPKAEDHGHAIAVAADVVPLTPSPPPEPLPEITNYSTLIATCRLRADQLQVSRLTLDELAGLPSGYVGKLLALKSGKRIGVESLGALLGALRIKLVAVPIDDGRQRAGLTKRNESQVRRGHHGGPKRSRSQRRAGKGEHVELAQDH